VRALTLSPLLAVILCACGDADAGDSGAGSSGATDSAADSSGEPTGAATTTHGTGTAEVTTDGTGTTAFESTTGEPEDPAWQDFLDAREDHLRALGVPILACVAKQDTQHPVFNGCIDWHSAVHATYALHAIYRHTGDPSHLAVAAAKLTPAALDAELGRVQQGLLPQEIPYGYAWFLTLARERELATGETDLLPLATEIRDQLRAWLLGRSEAQIDQGVAADDYANLSWAALNLWQWAQWTDDAELGAAMEAFVDEQVLDPKYDGTCPFDQEETDADDFFPPCLHRARLLVSTLEEGAPRDTWMAGWLPLTPVLTPIDKPAGAHISGLNFSRAWGLWSLYQSSGDPAYRDLYLDHMTTHLNHPQYWAEDYNNYAHWVAQFGVYAISQTYAP